MQLKHLVLGAFAAFALAQEAQDLNATLSSNNATQGLLTLLGAYPDLVETLGTAQNITILAPSTEAVNAILESDMAAALQADPGLVRAILTYHVLNGTYPASAIMNMSTFVPTLLTNETYTNVTGGQVVNAVALNGSVQFFSGLQANVTVVQPVSLMIGNSAIRLTQAQDLNFTGGVIHVIDSLLTLPQNVTATAIAANLTSLAGALTEADLLQAVNDLSDVTIFAPNNAAFQSIGSALPNLTAEDISNILTYHVVNGTVGYSSTLMDNMTLPTLNGGNVTINIQNGSVFVNGAQVVVPDVLVANGVIHVIDK